jgi:hypothetical protein
MDSQLPKEVVVRVSRGNFDPMSFAEVEQMTRATGVYLIPAIKKLAGLLSYYAGVSPDGSMVHVSVWDSEEHAQQMSALPEMIVDARAAADAVGVAFVPIVNYPTSWHI